MANQEHLDILKQGVEVWNTWREQHFEVFVDLDRIYHELQGTNFSGINFMNTKLDWTNLWKSDLSKANLSYTSFVRTNLQEANLNEANLERATLAGAFLEESTLKKANLSYANLRKADLSGADFSGADLSGANLFEANLSGTQFRGANLERANLARAILDRTDLTGANLTQCSVYGVSTWNLQLTDVIQLNLIITLADEPTITVDNIEMAQFIYLLLNNKKIRDVIDSITSKVVLILGRFTTERKAVLDAIRDELRKRDYLPVLFDFDKPASRDITETVSTLAHMARFVVADITDAKSIPQELMLIVPNLPSVPVQPLILASQHEYSMFEHFTRYPWVLPVYSYTNEASLLQSLQENVIEPADQKAQELAKQ
jgi:hypothetical protein